MEVLIVGAGGMGRLFARLFMGWGWEVSLTDIDKKKAEKAMKEFGIRKTISAEEADIVLVAVPISETPKMLEEFGRRMKRGALLLEIASVKELVVATMQRLKSRGLELVALHPLFGPGATDLRGERFAVVPIRTGKIFRQLHEKLLEAGAELIKTKAKEHDLKMARNQALGHLLLLSYLKFCEKGKLQTRLSRTFLEVAEAMLAGSPSLYYEIQIFNKYTPQARKELRRFWDKLDKILENREKEEFEKIFGELVKKYRKDVEQAYRRLYAS